MKVLITGVCGFVGSTLARELLEQMEEIEIIGLDNLSRPGSEVHRRDLLRAGVRVIHGDVRCASDFEPIEQVDWLIDAAANPSVLAGVDGRTSSRQVVEHNLFGTVNMLEFCRRHGSAFTLLSTSRAYSIPTLAGLDMMVEGRRVVPDPEQLFPAGVTTAGISEMCSTEAPVSLYGSTKLASETLALEYGETYGFQVWINRCGVLAGAGQFGRPDQGIFSFWVHSHARKAPLRYIGFGGSGTQVRDALHPRDLVPLMMRQIESSSSDRPRICNFGGGVGNSMSLAELTEFCDDRFGRHVVQRSSEDRPFDLPWVVMDCARAAQAWDWEPVTSLEAILEEIVEHAEENPNWLELSTGGMV